MLRAVADTHAFIWYLLGHPSLSNQARAFLDDILKSGDTVGISTITLVEVVYLTEKGRLKEGILSEIETLLSDKMSMFVELPLDRHVVQHMQRIPWKDIPDMPDRIIVATALYWGVPVVSRDRQIHSANIPVPVIW
ncbi:MAG: type II toxin-antitoxin system VapC family toxin [Chloroflexi bacterium]|nr:type II toxin-antitoxin system VapC family toxin [Chloroflexota bacterium]